MSMKGAVGIGNGQGRRERREAELKIIFVGKMRHKIQAKLMQISRPLVRVCLYLGELLCRIPFILN